MMPFAKKRGGVREEKKQAWVTGHIEFESFGTFHIIGNIQEKTGHTDRTYVVWSSGRRTGLM